MGQHLLPAGSKLRNIVFRNNILLVELDHGFQPAVADGRLLILPDILTVFALTSQIRPGKSCMTIHRNLCPESFTILVLMDCFCRKHEAGPRSMITAVRIGDHGLRGPAGLYLQRREGSHDKGIKLQTQKHLRAIMVQRCFCHYAAPRRR